MNILCPAEEFGSAHQLEQQQQNESILIDENTRRKSLGELRSLELNAYNHLLSALRAAGGLDEEKRQVMRVVREQLSIPDERHRAELRRVACDKKLSFIADTVSGSNLTDVKWFDEGREKFSELKVRRKYNAITSLKPEKFYREHKDKDYYPLLLNDLISHKLNQKEKNLNDYFQKQQLASTSILKQRKSNFKFNRDQLDHDNEREIINDDDQFKNIFEKVNVRVEDVGVDVLACRKKFAKKLINTRKMHLKEKNSSSTSSSFESSSDDASVSADKVPQSKSNKIGKNSNEGKAKSKVNSNEMKKKKIFPAKEKHKSPLAGNRIKMDSENEDNVGEENDAKKMTTASNQHDKRRKGFSSSRINPNDKTVSMSQNDKQKSPTDCHINLNKDTNEIKKIHRKIKGASKSKGFISTSTTSTSMKNNDNNINISLSSPTRKMNASPDITNPTFRSRFKLSEEIPKGMKRQVIIKRTPIKRKITGDIVKKKKFGKIKAHPQQQSLNQPLELEEGEIIQNFNAKLKSEDIPIPIPNIINQNKLEEVHSSSVATPKKSRRKSILTGRKMKAPPEDLEQQQGDFNNTGVDGRKNKRKSKNIKLADDFEIMMGEQASDGRLPKRKIKRPQVFMDFDLMDKDLFSSPISAQHNTMSATHTSNTKINIQNQNLNLKERKSPRKSQVSPQVYKSDFTYSSLPTSSISNTVLPEPPPQPTPVANYFSNSGLNLSSTNQYLRTSSNSIISSPADYYSTSYISRKIQQQQQQLKSSLANSSNSIQQTLVGNTQYKFITESIQQPKTFSTIHLPNNLSSQTPALQKIVPISSTTTTPAIIQQQISSASGSNSNSISINQINQNNSTTNSPSTTPATNNPPRKPHILSTAKLANRQIQSVSGNVSNTSSSFNNQQSIPIQLRTMQQGQHNIIFLQKSASPMTSSSADDHQKSLDSSSTTIMNSGNPPPPHQRAVILRRANLNRPGVMVFNNNVSTSASSSSPITISNSTASTPNTAFKSFNSQNLPLIQSGIQQNILKKTLTSNISSTLAKSSPVSSKEVYVDSVDASSYNLHSSGNTNNNTKNEEHSFILNRQQPNETEDKGKDFLAESLLKSNILEMEDFNQPGKNIHFQIINSPPTPKNTKVLSNDAHEHFSDSSKNQQQIIIDKNSELHSYLTSNPENSSNYRSEYEEEVVQTEEMKFS